MLVELGCFIARVIQLSNKLHHALEVQLTDNNIDPKNVDRIMRTIGAVNKKARTSKN